MTSSIVAFGSNSSFVVPLTVAVGSLSQHYDGPIAVAFEDFPAEDRQVVEHAAGNNPIRWVQVPPPSLDGLPPGRLDRAQWYRLAMPNLMTDVDRLVYIDADTLITNSIDELLTVDLDGAPLGAVQNLRAPYVSSTDGLVGWKHYNVDPSLAYFNSGLMVIDAQRWRDEGSFQEVAAAATELSIHNLRAGSDQDALNAAFAGQWQELPFRYNQHPIVFAGHGHHHQLMTPEELATLRTEPAIVHFIGRAKPWLYPCTHPFTDRWLEAVRQFGFDTFEPKRRSVITKAAGRLRRASSVLFRR